MRIFFDLKDKKNKKEINTLIIKWGEKTKELNCNLKFLINDFFFIQMIISLKDNTQQRIFYGKRKIQLIKLKET